MERRRKYLAAALVLVAVVTLALMSHRVLPASSMPKWGVANDPGARMAAEFKRHAKTFDWLRTTDLFVFGDSFCQLDLYGSKLTPASTRATSITDGKPAGLDTHFGLKWCDYLFAWSLPHGRYYNYAKDGATIDAALVPPRLEASGVLDEQLTAFAADQKAAGSHGEWNAATSLFVVLLGINDVREMARREVPSPELGHTAAALPDALLRRLSTLYDLGARHFLTFSLPPLQHAPKYASPAGIGHNVSSFLARGVEGFNAALPASVRAWEHSHSGADMMVFPYHLLFEIMQANEAAFGITDTIHFRVDVDGHDRDPGTVGFAYQDPSHMTWPIAQTLARSVNAFLVQRSAGWEAARRTEKEIHV